MPGIFAPNGNRTPLPFIKVIIDSDAVLDFQTMIMKICEDTKRGVIPKEKHLIESLRENEKPFREVFDAVNEQFFLLGQHTNEQSYVLDYTFGNYTNKRKERFVNIYLFPKACVKNFRLPNSKFRSYVLDPDYIFPDFMVKSKKELKNQTVFVFSENSSKSFFENEFKLIENKEEGALFNKSNRKQNFHAQLKHVIHDGEVYVKLPNYSFHSNHDYLNRKRKEEEDSCVGTINMVNNSKKGVFDCT